MGRKKISIKKICAERQCRVTLKKRRISLLKKAMQLSILTGAKISLSIYLEKDKSLLEYHSDGVDLNSSKSIKVAEHAKFTNANYDIVTRLDDTVIKHGSINDSDFLSEILASVDGRNIAQLF